MQSCSGADSRYAPLSATLAAIFRGKLCDVVLAGRALSGAEKGETIYDAGDESRVLYFLRSGFVKVGTITEDGRELVYDIRKAGDVFGELCAAEAPRPDRALALEMCTFIAVPLDHLLTVVQRDQALLLGLVQVFCGSLSNAYDQLSSVAFDGTVERLVKVLHKLGLKLGRDSPQGLEIAAYLTQEELAQMVAARRERVSLAMNFLRDRGLVQYSRRGYLVLNQKGIESFDGATPSSVSVAASAAAPLLPR
jgi:CRP/FNR family transcriptional regulator, cyclic AMP receptor protein